MSNGSEHTPERCVHAVDGPDWAGLRELYPAAEGDHEALIEELHQLREPYSYSRHLGGRAAFVIKALVDERDALQARLDVMRVEERWQRIALDARGRIIPGRLVTEQRLVGPWTVVPEGEQQ